MLELTAQFYKHTGPLATGEHRITFDVQKEHAEVLYNILNQMEKFPQVQLSIKLLGDNDNTDRSDLWLKQNRKIHALIDEISEIRKMQPDKMKEAIKKELIEKQAIQQSLRELNTIQQGELLNILEEDLINAKFED